MGQTCILTGMVLSVSPAGEYDRRILLLTKERGKVTAFVRGARRPKSAMQAATNLFCFGRFEAYEGREAYTVVRAEVQNYFRELYGDLEKSYYGCYALELADYFTQPGNEASGQLKLLYQTLRAFGSDKLDPRLVRRVYELKTLIYYGVSPQVFSCMHCGGKEALSLFSLHKRGVFCRACAEGKTGFVLDGATLYTLQYIAATPPEKLYNFRLTEEVYTQVAAIISAYLRLYLDRELKTRMFLPEE